LKKLFKRNFLKGTFFKELFRVKEHASGVQSRFCLEPFIESHRIHQLGSLAKFALSRLNWLRCPGGGFNGHQSRVSNKIYSELHTLSTCKGSVESFSILFKVLSAYYELQKRQKKYHQHSVFLTFS